MGGTVHHLDVGITLYLGDCRNVLQTLEGVDALLGDPPYGINYGAMTGGTTRRTGAPARCAMDRRIIGDDAPFDPSHLLGYPVVVLWGGNHYSSRLPDSRGWLIWDKRDGTPPDNNADVEMAWTNLDRPARMYRHMWRGLVRAGEENVAVGGGRLHPAQKPVGLMSWVIQHCRLAPGSLIVDPYMGSGTTGIAAIRAGMRFIGIEIDARHLETACDRIARELAQPRLVLPPPMASRQEALEL